MVSQSQPVLTRLTASGGSNDNFACDASIYPATVIVDPNFGVTEASLECRRVLAIQPDGKILFIYFASDYLFHFVRLNADGSLDPSFNGTTLPAFDLSFGSTSIFDPYTYSFHVPANGEYVANPPLFDAEILPDGRILLAGRFTSYGGLPARGLVRLLPDGTVDNNFSAGGGAQWTSTMETAALVPAVEQIEKQNDGTFLLGGTFEKFNGTPAPGLVLITATAGSGRFFAVGCPGAERNPAVA